MRRHQSFEDREYGYEIGKVTSGGRALAHTINDTMMRIDLPQPLRPGQSVEFTVEFAFNIVEEAAVGARSGYERFAKSDTYQYFMAQWFPRLAAYTDYTGWQHKQFLGRGEFTLEFGDYDVEIDVPADHVVTSTGVLQNPDAVLTATQRARLKEAAKLGFHSAFLPKAGLDGQGRHDISLEAGGDVTDLVAGIAINTPQKRKAQSSDQG